MAESFADALVSLSLIGSLFFSLSLEASRNRILLYLVLTALPLAVVAPIVGPTLDRFRNGYRGVIFGSQLLRVVLTLLLARSLLSLGFYPLVFAVLLCRKAYGLGRTAMLTHIVLERRSLVSASAHLSRTGTIAAGVGTALGGLILTQSGPETLLILAAVVFAVAAAFARSISVSDQFPEVDDPTAAGDASPTLHRSSWAVAATRAAVGAVTFLLAMALKRGGNGEWVYAAGLVAGGVGAFAGTVVAGRLHRILAAERMLALALVLPGAVCLLGVLTVGNLSIVIIAFVVGLGASVASRAIDAIYTLVPGPARGRAVARSELRLQLANLAGAALSVQFAPSPRPGFAAVAVVLLAAGVAYGSQSRLSLRAEATRYLLHHHAPAIHLELPFALLQESERLADLGAYRMSVCAADCAVRSMHARAERIRPLPVEPDWSRHGSTIAAVLSCQHVPTASETSDIVGSARGLVERASEDPALAIPEGERARRSNRGSDGATIAATAPTMAPTPPTTDDLGLLSRFDL